MAGADADGDKAEADEATPGGDAPSAWARWYPVATTFVAPATFLTGVLFYYGYVWSRAQYRYFGVDVDTIGLSTRDYVMRSPQALLVPLLVVPIVGAALLTASRLLDRRLSSRALTAVGWCGAAAVAAGIGMLAAYRWLSGWPYYPLVTPLVLAGGLLLVIWWSHRRRERRDGTVLAWLALAVCVFWATATLAEWNGAGAARRTARHLDRLPAVVLDTPEQLHLGLAGEAGVTESALPEQEGQEFRYRYRGLRLLIQAGDQMFLVPGRWTPSGSTVLVPIDEVRVRFRFVDDPP